jgi:hypothetical protein
MRVLVVARTRMGGDRVCVGGLALDDGTSTRLLGSDGWNLPEDHPIRPGEIWDLTYRPRDRVEPPHVEDVIVSRGKPIDTVSDMQAQILTLIEPWTERVESIFEGCLTTTDSGGAYLPPTGRMPSCSTGFWLSDRDVRVSHFEDRGIRYWIPDAREIRGFKYVGMDDPIDIIPSGSLIRFSLSRWGEFPPGVGERRCYLQLSGWYC